MRNSFPFEVQPIPSKQGLGLVLTRTVQPGELVLEEAPALLNISHSQAHRYCAHCLRTLHPYAAVLDCDACQAARFCGHACRNASARPGGCHTPLACALLQCARWRLLTDAEADALRFLIRVTSLHFAAASGDASAATRYNGLLALAGVPDPSQPFTIKLHTELRRAMSLVAEGSPAFTPQQVASLLAQEGQNGYAILAPRCSNRQREVRGNALCLSASRINHECVPNIARFDDFDTQGLLLRFRALHELQAGQELVQSYYPLLMDLESRQQHSRDSYHFTCTCARCKLDTWTRVHALTEWEQTDMCPFPRAQQIQHSAVPSKEWKPAFPHDALVPTYLQLFLLKYVCPYQQCFGTMAPIRDTLLLECNMCRRTRAAADFLQEDPYSRH